MCVSKSELNAKVAEIRSLKALKEETESAIKALEVDVISFLNEMEECAATDKKGNPIRQYIGSDFKATYSERSRETVDKAMVKSLLNDEEYQEISKISYYHVLKISWRTG